MLDKICSVRACIPKQTNHAVKKLLLPTGEKVSVTNGVYDMFAKASSAIAAGIFGLQNNKLKETESDDSNLALLSDFTQDFFNHCKRFNSSQKEYIVKQFEDYPILVDIAVCSKICGGKAKHRFSFDDIPSLIQSYKKNPNLTLELIEKKQNCGQELTDKYNADDIMHIVNIAKILGKTFAIELPNEQLQFVDTIIGRITNEGIFDGPYNTKLLSYLQKAQNLYAENIYDSLDENTYDENHILSNENKPNKLVKHLEYKASQNQQIEIKNFIKNMILLNNEHPQEISTILNSKIMSENVAKCIGNKYEYSLKDFSRLISEFQFKHCSLEQQKSVLTAFINKEDLNLKVILAFGSMEQYNKFINNPQLSSRFIGKVDKRDVLKRVLNGERIKEQSYIIIQSLYEKFPEEINTILNTKQLYSPTGYKYNLGRLYFLINDKHFKNSSDERKQEILKAYIAGHDVKNYY